MNPFKLSRKEIFDDLLGHRFIRLAILVVSIIPLLYGVLYLWAFWDPYGHLNNMSVAVVNEDSGTTSNEKTVNFGNDLVNDLKGNQILKWDFVNESDAAKGLESHKYYAEIKIPTNFSANILSVSSDDPKQANIEFKAREANSMIASQLSNRVATQISENMSHQITKNYLDNIFLQTRGSAEKLQEAAQGSGQLSGGLATALDGSEKLKDGTQAAYTGSQSLVLGINKILLGDKSLNEGINQSLTGAQTLRDGISQSSDGAKALTAGSASLKTGISQANAGVTQLLTNLSATNTNLQLAQNYLADPNTTISDAKSPFNGLTKLQAANAIISGILTQANSPENKANIVGLQTGMQQLATGSTTLDDGINDLSTALNNQIKPGSSELATGLGQLSAGSNDLTNGLTDALTGSKNLSQGLAQVTTGTTTLNSGISSAQTGAESLGSQLSEGAKVALQSSDVSLVEKSSPIMADPIKLEDNSIAKIKNYGTGFSPYFIPLALWVGSLVLFLVIKLNDRKEEIKPRAYYFSKFLTLAKIGTIQAVILCLVLIFALGLRPLHYVYFFLFTILISWAFLIILQLLVSAFQDAGKFFGIVLLMLQLTSASGTYPVQTSPNFFQAINPYLPMTYAVSGLREIISGGNLHNIAISFLWVALFLVVFMLILMLFSRQIAKSKLDLTV